MPAVKLATSSPSVEALRLQADNEGLPHKEIMQYSWTEEGFKLRIVLSFSEVVPGGKVRICAKVPLSTNGLTK